LEWLEQNKLNTESHPAEWFDPFLPTSVRAHDPRNTVNLDQWTNYTYMKAFIAQASGGNYDDSFTPFKTKEIKRFIGLQMLHGLSPSPQLSQKFRTQEKDPVKGNDLWPSRWEQTLKRGTSNGSVSLGFKTHGRKHQQGQRIQTGKLTHS